jgi:hypothetical protein
MTEFQSKMPLFFEILESLLLATVGSMKTAETLGCVQAAANKGAVDAQLHNLFDISESEKETWAIIAKTLETYCTICPY